MNDEEKCDFTIKYRWRYERLYMKCCSDRHRVTFVWLHYFEIELNIIVNWESHALTWCWYKVLWLKVLYGNVCRMHRIQMAQKTRRALSITKKTHNSLSMALECALCSVQALCCAVLCDAINYLSTKQQIDINMAWF